MLAKPHWYCSESVSETLRRNGAAILYHPVLPPRRFLPAKFIFGMCDDFGLTEPISISILILPTSHTKYELSSVSLFLKDVPILAPFCWFSSFNIAHYCSSQQDSNSDCQSRRQQYWPLHHHLGQQVLVSLVGWLLFWMCSLWVCPWFGQRWFSLKFEWLVLGLRGKRSLSA